MGHCASQPRPSVAVAVRGLDDQRSCPELAHTDECQRPPKSRQLGEDRKRLTCGQNDAIDPFATFRHDLRLALLVVLGYGGWVQCPKLGVDMRRREFISTTESFDRVSLSHLILV